MIDGAEYPLWPANTGGHHYTKTVILAEVAPKGCFIAPEIIRPVGSHSNRPVYFIEPDQPDLQSFLFFSIAPQCERPLKLMYHRYFEPVLILQSHVNQQVHLQ